MRGNRTYPISLTVFWVGIPSLVNHYIRVFGPVVERNCSNRRSDNHALQRGRVHARFQNIQSPLQSWIQQLSLKYIKVKTNYYTAIEKNKWINRTAIETNLRVLGIVEKGRSSVEHSVTTFNGRVKGTFF